MRKRGRILALVLLVVLATVGIFGCSKADTNKTIKFGTGGKGGNYYSYGSKLSQMVSEKESVDIEIKETAGSAANIRLVSQGFLDMAIVQSDMLEESQEGFHVVTGLYTESCQIVVRADSNIKTVKDLVGKKISIGELDSGVLGNAKMILKSYGIASSEVKAVNMSFSDAANALESGEIDAFFCTASSPTTAVAELSARVKIRLLPINDNVADIIIAHSGNYVKNVIKAGTYDGLDEDITTVGVSAVLIASDNLDKSIEDAFVSVLKEHNEELQDISFGVAVEEPAKDKTLKFNLDMYMTLTLAVAVLYLGAFLRKRVRFLEVFCIPAPVIGGLIFAILSCVLYVTGIAEFTFDETLKNICMIMFFTSVGFQANLKVLKSGGLSLLIFLGCVIVLIVGQNGLAVGLSKLLNVDPLIGMCTGSIPMVGGHGTAGAFGLVLEDLGLTGATTLCTAAATFGLIAGSLLGGPIGRRLILKHDLLKTVVEEDDSVLVEDEVKHRRSVSMYAPAAYQMAIAMGIGTVVSLLLSKTGMTFPAYIGAMIVAAFMRNVGEYTGKFTVHMGEINDIGGICLSFFLGIAMITLKLWQLADLALPLMVLLVAQVLLMAVFSYFVVYNICGRNYDAAVLSAGTCGFGMGATPNAMANMQALTEKFAPSVKAYLLVPIVGSMFADFINSLCITFFINFV